MSRQQLSLFDRKLIGPALLDSVRKLDPRVQWRNPVMFVVYIGTIVTALLYAQALAGHGEQRKGDLSKPADPIEGVTRAKIAQGLCLTDRKHHAG